MARQNPYLTPILTGATRRKYLFIAAVWLAAVIYFWQWWLTPSHNISTLRYGLATFCMGWITFLQAYFVIVFLSGARSSSPAPYPGRYRVAIAAPTPAPAINQLHTWTVTLTDAQGHPVHGAHFSVAGGMPQHGHGYPTQPRVTRELADLIALSEGLPVLAPSFQAQRTWTRGAAVSGDFFPTCK